MGMSLAVQLHRLKQLIYRFQGVGCTSFVVPLTRPYDQVQDQLQRLDDTWGEIGKFPFYLSSIPPIANAIADVKVAEVNKTQTALLGHLLAKRWVARVELLGPGLSPKAVAQAYGNTLRSSIDQLSRSCNTRSDYYMQLFADLHDECEESCGRKVGGGEGSSITLRYSDSTGESVTHGPADPAFCETIADKLSDSVLSVAGCYPCLVTITSELPPWDLLGELIDLSAGGPEEDDPRTLVVGDLRFANLDPDLVRVFRYVISARGRRVPAREVAAMFPGVLPEKDGQPRLGDLRKRLPSPLRDCFESERGVKGGTRYKGPPTG